MLKCDLCGADAQRPDLTAHAADVLSRLVNKGFGRPRLEITDAVLKNKAAFESTAHSKWNSSFDDWLFCHQCTAKVADFKNVRRAGVVFLVLGLLVIAVTLVMSWPSPNIILIIVGAVCCLIAVGALSKPAPQESAPARDFKADLESLRNIKITPAMIEFAKQELRKEVPNLLVQLQDSRPDKRASAARILGEASDAGKSVVSALTTALEDSDFRVQTNAAVSLNKLRPDWTKSVNAEVMAPKLASAIIENKHALDYDTRLSVIDAIEKMDSVRGEGLRMLLKFEQDIDSAVKESAIGKSLGFDPQSLDMKDKLTLLLGQMAQNTKPASQDSESPFKHVTGQSLFYRCPSCNVLLKKRSVEGIADAVGTTSCSECKASFPYDDVYYKGIYDVPEVEGKCPSCAAVLRGPTDDLLGKSCPSCGEVLPASAG